MVRSLPEVTRPETRRVNLRLLRGRDHYEELVARELPRARVSIWIATANLKDLHMEAPVGSRARAGGRMMSALELLSSRADADVEVRILHGRAPSGPFARRLASRRRAQGKLKLRQCPRVHMKLVAIDGSILY